MSLVCYVVDRTFNPEPIINIKPIQYTKTEFIGGSIEEVEHLKIKSIKHWTTDNGDLATFIEYEDPEEIVEEDITHDYNSMVWFGWANEAGITIKIDGTIIVNPSLSKKDVVKILFKCGWPNDYKRIYGDR